MFDRTVYKLAAFDLDGTILDDGEMSAATHKMLIALHSFGLHIAIATGRHLHSIPSAIIDLPFIRYVIASNGAHVVDLADKCTISYSPIDKDKASQLASSLKQKVKELDIFLKEELVISVESLEELKRVFSKGGNETKLLPDYLKSAQIAASPCLYVLEKNSEVEKFYGNFSSEAECSILLAEIKREFDVEAITTTGNDIEITARGINKGYGINVLSKHLGVNLEQVIVFGDGGNDIEMMKQAGYAIAMGNSNDDVKAVADYIAADVRNDGVAKAIQILFEL